MEGSQEKVSGEKFNKTDDLMDLLIRDPDSLCREDLERLCEAISRDALSTKNAVANEEYPPRMSNCDYSNPCNELPIDLTPRASHKGNGSKTTVTESKLKSLQNQNKTSFAMASGDGPHQTSCTDHYFEDATLAAQQVPIKIITTSRQSGTVTSNSQLPVEDTASKRVFSALGKSGTQLIKFSKSTPTQTIRPFPIAPMYGKKSATAGFLVRSNNGVTVTCPYENASFQVGQPTTTFFAMPSRQMKYTVPCSEQAIATTNWLLEHFEENILSTMPRNAMYQAYVGRFSASEKVKHFNQAVFGKMVRACFPNLTTRRLGVRGHSRYHYSGLGVKPTSIYAGVLATQAASLPRMRCATKWKRGNREQLGVAANVTIDSGGNSVGTTEDISTDNRETCDTDDIPSQFPGVEELLDIPEDVDREAWKLFITFYTEYNSQLFTFMSSLDHEKTKDHLQKLGTLLPEECGKLLQSTFMRDVIRVFDGILFKQATSSLLPHCMATLSSEFKVSLRKFARAYVEWMSSVFRMGNIPEGIHEVRLESANQWADHIKRVTTLCHVAKEARKSLKDNAVTKQLRLDLAGISLEEISLLSSWCGAGDVTADSVEMEAETAARFMSTVLATLKGRARLDEYVSLIDKIVREQIFRSSKDKRTSVERQFLMKWSMYSSKILTEITLKSSASVGTFHLLSLLFGDYINHLICCKRENDTLRRIASRVIKKLSKEVSE